MKLSLSGGIKFAAFGFVFNVLMAIGSYLTGCLMHGAEKCSGEQGAMWIAQHPVFPTMIPAMTALGFVFGLFANAIPADAELPGKHRWLAWLAITLLIIAFALWGVPELMVWRELRAGEG